MQNNLCFAKIVVALLIIHSGISLVFAQQATAPAPVTIDDIKANIDLAPCKNSERLEAVKKLFRSVGASDGEMKVEKYSGLQNLVVSRKGKSEETIVLSAHYDKVTEGCGAIDNWSGIVVLANIYRVLKAFQTEKSYLFVAFDEEESGLRGSNAMAKAIPKEKKQTYCSNINLDSFGLSFAQSLDNVSSPSMTKLAETIAEKEKIRFSHASIYNAGADSQSFISNGIPAITFHGMNNDWSKFLHSSDDVVKNVDVKSVFLGLQFALTFISEVDGLGCGVFRKDGSK